jgi:hypothetical protein
MLVQIERIILFVSKSESKICINSKEKLIKKFLQVKTKRLRNPKKITWDRTRTRRVNVTATGTGSGPKLVYAMKGFPISAELSRKDNFPGTILYYFEITVFDHRWVIMIMICYLNCYMLLNESNVFSNFSLVLLGLSSKSISKGNSAHIFAGPVRFLFDIKLLK